MNPLPKIRQGFQHGVHPHPYKDQTSGLHTQGESKMLIKALFGKEVPVGQRSRDLEMTMNNVGKIVAILKSSSGILAFTAHETARPTEYPCGRCGRCAEACPYFLNPSLLSRLAKARLYDEMKSHSIMECVECGSCTYSCPSGIPIVQLIRAAKDNIRHKKRKSS